MRRKNRVKTYRLLLQSRPRASSPDLQDKQLCQDEAGTEKSPLTASIKEKDPGKRIHWS